jgi:hypothetical protein
MIAACRKLNVDTDFVINAFDSHERARLADHVFEKADPSDRERFCAWQVMNTHTRDKLFVHKDAAFEQLRKWNAVDAMALFVPHPTKPSCAFSSASCTRHAQTRRRRSSRGVRRRA